MCPPRRLRCLHRLRCRFHRRCRCRHRHLCHRLRHRPLPPTTTASPASRRRRSLRMSSRRRGRATARICSSSSSERGESGRSRSAAARHAVDSRPTRAAAEERRRDDRSTPVTPRGPTPRPGHVPRPTAAARSDRMPDGRGRIWYWYFRSIRGPRCISTQVPWLRLVDFDPFRFKKFDYIRNVHSTLLRASLRPLTRTRSLSLAGSLTSAALTTDLWAVRLSSRPSTRRLACGLCGRAAHLRVRRRPSAPSPPPPPLPPGRLPPPAEPRQAQQPPPLSRPLTCLCSSPRARFPLATIILRASPSLVCSCRSSLAVLPLLLPGRHVTVTAVSTRRPNPSSLPAVATCS